MDAAEDFVLPQDLVFVDLETTGGNAAVHRITEVGVVRVEKGEPVEEWSSLVNPECRIPAAIESFTGISNEMVASAPRFADIAKLVLAKLKSPTHAAPIFVAHNARFDYSFLRAEFRRLELDFSAPVLCTVKLSRRLFPEHARHSLDALMERHALVCSARHRALGDARVLCDFWFTLRRELPESRLASAARIVLGRHRLPAHLPAGLADELPDAPGVYRLFGEDEAPLYIGRSHCLRTRVLGHFIGEVDGKREQKLERLVRRIDWRQTSGELGAALLESTWIEAQQPLFNRHFKPAADAVVLQVEELGSAVHFEPAASLRPHDLLRCRGLFHSERDARKALLDIANAHGLCLKVLGLEQSAGSCVAHQLGKCKGACTGKEPLALHNIRTHTALSALKLMAWPFPGRVALRERDALGNLDLHVIEHWSYVGTARNDEELASLAQEPAPPGFDARVYRILARHFAKHPKLDWLDLKRSPHVH
jgi:DNA polymerase III subunit epsilon